jgi:hypothetical protein
MAKRQERKRQDWEVVSRAMLPEPRGRGGAEFGVEHSLILNIEASPKK